MPNDHEVTLNDAPVLFYCAEEVHRQGHDLRRYDGVLRVGYMLDAWAFALSMRREREFPEYRDLVKIGKLIERDINKGGLRRSEVSIEGHQTPPWQDVPRQLAHLLAYGVGIAPLEFYREFERIHPFRSGNGRAGKVLLNWLANTLEAPFFPPHDFWGRVMVNP